ncbi:MAG: hypothetical protein KC415_02045, partial [Anaerolineales bacterium]|nr:hypothetical protein [Anaerolineales bacterium]
APLTAQLQVNIQPVQNAALEIKLDPDRRTLYPDGEDMIALWARVTLPNQQAEASPALQAANDSITFRRPGVSADWLYDNDPQVAEDWHAFWVKSVDLPAMIQQFGPVRPPKQVSVLVEAVYQEQLLSQSVSFKLVPLPLLNVTPDRATFLADEQAEIKLEATLDGQWPGPWQFSAEFADEALADVRLVQTNERQAAITLSGPWGAPEGGLRLSQSYLHSNLTIKATRDDLEIEAEVPVLVYREGIYVADGLDAYGRFRIRGDISPDDPNHVTRLQLRVLRWNAQSREVYEDAQAAANLQFSPADNNSERARNILSGAQLAIQHVGGGGRPFGVWQMALDRIVPGRESFSEPLYLDITTNDDEPLTQTLPADIFLARPDDSQEWQKAYANCRHIIETFLPEPLRSQKLVELERSKRGWGVAELNDYRHRIWNKASDMIMQEGADWQRQAAQWDRLLYWAEWVKWVNDRAFILTLKAMVPNPISQQAIPILKTGIESFLETYIMQPQMDYWGWFKGWMFSIIGDLGNLGVEEFKKRGDWSNYRFYAVLAMWRFITHYCLLTTPEGQPKGVYKSLQDAFWDVTGAALENTLQGFFQQWGKNEGYSS